MRLVILLTSYIRLSKELPGMTAVTSTGDFAHTRANRAGEAAGVEGHSNNRFSKGFRAEWRLQ
jgi:hypothetical protein